MIRCMLFLDPNGTSEITEWEVLGRIDITNDLLKSLETSGKRGAYRAQIYKKRPRIWKTISLPDFPRQSYHPWEMIRQILNLASVKNGGHV